MKLTKNPAFLHYFHGEFVICFEIYVYFLASEDDKWVSWPAKILASPFKGLFILHGNCDAVPIYQLLSAASHRSFTAFQVKMNVTFMRHRNAVTSQFPCRMVQCGKATQLRYSMNGRFTLQGSALMIQMNIKNQNVHIATLAFGWSTNSVLSDSYLWPCWIQMIWQ